MSASMKIGPSVGLADDRDGRERRAGRDQVEDPSEDLVEVEPPLLRRRGPGEIQERLDRALQATDLLLQHRQGTTAQAGRVAALDGGLDEDLHRGEGIAQLVREPGRQLAEGRELLGPERLALGPLEPLDHRADLVGHPPQQDVQALDVPVRREVDRPHDPVQLARGDADRDAELVDRAADPRAIP